MIARSRAPASTPASTPPSAPEPVAREREPPLAPASTKAGTPWSTRAPPNDDVATTSAPPSRTSTPDTCARRSASARPMSSGSPLATIARADAGTIARSSGSRASKAGTRALSVRTQPTTRAAWPGSSGATGTAAGNSSRCSSARVAIRPIPRRRPGRIRSCRCRQGRAQGGRAQRGRAPDRPIPAGRRADGPGRGRREAARTRPRSRRSDRTPDDPQLCIGPDPRPDPAAREVERDEQAGDERAEGQPDDVRAGILLGDHDRRPLDPAQRDDQPGVGRRGRVADAEGHRKEVLGDERSVGLLAGHPVRDGDERRDAGRASVRSSSWRPSGVPGCPSSCRARCRPCRSGRPVRPTGASRPIGASR